MDYVYGWADLSLPELAGVDDNLETRNSQFGGFGKGGRKVKNRVASILLAVALILGVGLVGCGGEQVPQYNLTISSTEGGSVTSPGEPGPYIYDEGEVVNLVAKADEGYQFASWTGDVGEIADVEESTTFITMKDDYSITATFAVKQYNLVIHSTEGGSVTTPGENAYTYEKGEVVNLVAVADEGYVFIDWTGDVGTIADVNAASTTITMNGGYSITANFAKGIWDWYDLDAIRDNLDDSYVLMNDLDSATAGYTELASQTANGGKGWEPIGSILVDPLPSAAGHPAHSFTGSLDGHGYETRDLFVNHPDEDGVGLFSCVFQGVIENVRMVDAAVTGRVYVGGLVGENEGTISNCHSAGSVTGSGCDTNYGWVGGLVGSNGWEGTVSNSSSVGSVTGGWFVGGLVGGNSGTVRNSYSGAKVSGSAQHTGGLVGANWHIVSTSYSTGTVIGAANVGGLVGWNHGGTVSDSYSTGRVTGNWGVGGLVGQNHEGTVSNSHYSYDEVFINGRNIITIGALSGEDFERWLADDRFLDINERLPQEDGYYVINDVGDFKQLLAFGQDDSLRFRLKADLDLGDEANFFIPYLAGKFDGNGHRIANLSFSSDFSTQVGLFGYLAASGAVTGVGVVDVNITGGGTVGGLVGENEGTVSDSYSAGRMTGGGNVGGLVGWIGWHGGTVSNSYYNYDEVLINGRRMITIGALLNEDFSQWLADDRLLDINERLAQEDGYYMIDDVSDFKQLLAFGQNASLKFRLTSDLDLGNESNFYIPYLAGELDGNGHRIRSLRLNFDFVAPVGLLGYLGSGGKVSQLGVENIDIDVAGSQQVGGLAGSSVGVVSTSYSTGSVSGGGDVGGLVGWNRGTVSNSYSSSSVSGDSVGGLIGSNVWHAGTVSNSYSTGSMTGSYQVGGLVGSNDDTVSNSFWDMQASGQSTSAGGTGKTTTEMKSVATFSDAGWNIVAVGNPDTRNPSYIWNIVDGQTYPFLSWQS